jgi:hypothetical protein
MSNNRRFIEEEDKVRVETDTLSRDGQAAVVTVYVSKDYVAKTEKMVIENYLNTAVTDIVRRTDVDASGHEADPSDGESE